MLSSQNPAHDARRRTELCEKLGCDNPVCFYCGYAEPVALRRARGKFRKALLKHHPMGRKHDPDLIVIVCLNCHAVLHELISDDDLRRELNPIKQVEKMLRAEIVHHEMMANTRRMQVELLSGEWNDP